MHTNVEKLIFCRNLYLLNMEKSLPNKIFFTKWNECIGNQSWRFIILARFTYSISDLFFPYATVKTERNQTPLRKAGNRSKSRGTSSSFFPSLFCIGRRRRRRRTASSPTDNQQLSWRVWLVGLLLYWSARLRLCFRFFTGFFRLQIRSRSLSLSSRRWRQTWRALLPQLFRSALFLSLFARRICTKIRLRTGWDQLEFATRLESLEIKGYVIMDPPKRSMMLKENGANDNM